uniref:DNA-directed RNA polymerase subunit beta n=1 Tax=Ishige okamurae TaxID=233772 RepID=A0A8E5XRD8_9PHAE|nr:RNA polymerase beta subunit [Ishige okamurae]QVJ99585.1 RNA polymerase beta subunit [Ishige okamurae]
MKKNLNTKTVPQKFSANLPDLSEIQRISFCWFLTDGLPQEVTNYPSMINQKSNIELLVYGQEYKIRYPRYSTLTALRKRGNYSLKIYVLMGLRKKKVSPQGILHIQNSNIKEQVFLGELPLMTRKGTFIFNGCERIIINQLIRSPGVYYKRINKDKRILFEATVITNHGSWLTFELEYNLIWVRIDKKYRIPINWFLIGLSLSEQEIYGTIQNYDFLRSSIRSMISLIDEKMNKDDNFEDLNLSIYFAILRTKELLKTRVLSADYYDLGEIGRLRLNQKLGINVPLTIKILTSLDILKIIDSLINISLYNGKLDDIDNLENRRVRSIGELLQLQLRTALTRLKSNILSNEKFPMELSSTKKPKKRRKSKEKNVSKKAKRKNLSEDETTKVDSNLLKSIPTGKDKAKINLASSEEVEVLRPSYLVSPRIMTSIMREFFGLSPLSQYFDETNALAQITHKRRISSLGPGGLNGEHVSFAARDIHPTQYGRLCPIETPEGQKAGLISSLATYAKLNRFGFVKTPFFRAYRGEVLKNSEPIYLTAEKEDFYRIAAADVPLTSDNFFKNLMVPVRFNKEFITVEKSNVDLIAVSPIQIISTGASLIPFLEHDDANRALMGSNMQRQAVPLLYPKKPIVGTGIEYQVASDSKVGVVNLLPGRVKSVHSDRIIITTDFSSKIYFLDKYRRSNQETIINQKPIIWPGELVEIGQIIADGPAMDMGELALGQNLTVAYMPWEGYNYEDAILVSDKLVRNDIFTSIHVEKHQVQVKETPTGVEEVTRELPNISVKRKANLDKNGLVKIGTFVRPDDILVGKLTPKATSEEMPESKLLRAVFNIKASDLEDTSLRLPNGISGRILDIQTLCEDNGTRLPSGISKLIYIFIAQLKKIKIGDKIAGRHGNKGIISNIVPIQDMPFLPDGTSVDILLNPLGVPSRMNVGQIFECLLGLAGDYLNRRFKMLPFDEMYKPEASRTLVNKKLRQAAIQTNNPWLFNNHSPGKVLLTDGRTGEVFENPILVGKPYIIKLIHLVDKKIHARSTGPYSLVTQQPLGGRSKHGGQRFGEMEVWALEAFGVAYTLQELLTIKSDDMDGRNAVFNAIIKGHAIPKPGIPESFKVLIRELHALGLDITTHAVEKLETGEIVAQKVDLLDNFTINLSF